MPGQMPLQRRPEPVRDAAPGHAAAHGLNDAPRVAQLAGLGRALNAPRQARVANPVVQLYHLAAPGGGAATLHSQSPEPQVQGAKGARRLHYPRQQTASHAATFRVSDDDTVAIHSTTDEPKEFFALNSVFNAANAALNAAESAVRLKKVAGQVMFAGRTLPAIGPVPVLGDTSTANNAFPELWSHICLDLTSAIMGNQGNSDETIVLRDAGSGAGGTIRIQPDANGDPKVNRLAQDLVNTPAVAHNPHGRIGTALGAATAAAIPGGIGQGYGTALHGGHLDAQTQQLGVNQHAAPDVGEGFATFSIQAGATKDDYATTGARRARPKAWGHHHASVVARSVDGRDWVTLQNYNRNPQSRDVGLAEIEQQYRAAAVAKLQALRRSGQRISPAKARKLIIAYMDQRRPNAQADYLKLAASSALTGDDLWFFRMYGSNHGQSFHEEQAASGGYFNPLTVRVRRDSVARHRTAFQARLGAIRGALAPALAAVNWQPARANIDLVANGVVAAFAAMTAPLDALGENRTDAAEAAAVAQVRQNYTGWLTGTLVPRLTGALQAVRRGPLTAVPVTLTQLKVQAALADAAPGRAARIGDYLSDRNWFSSATNYSRDRAPALVQLRVAINGVPAAI